MNDEHRSPANAAKPRAEDLTIQRIGTPDWARDVVWYQIFPDRFCNGDPTNDPTLDSLLGAHPHDLDSPWQVHPWTSDWYRLQPYERVSGKDLWFNLERRRFGGDLQGIIQKLGYLEDLGVGGIYLNPIFWSPSLHRYDAATYHHVDPYLGPDPDGDIGRIALETPDEPESWVWTSSDELFLELIERAHERKIRIIIDGVFNHVGLRHWAFQDVVKHRRDSRFADWFTIKDWGDPDGTRPLQYKCWWNFMELPEWRQDKNGIVEGPRKYIFDITRRWMDPAANGDVSRGVDGWRLDVAFCIRHAFWKDWRVHVKSINRDAYIVAEVVDKIEENEPFLRGDEFDAVMNYNFAFACAEFFVEDRTRITASEFETRLRELRDAFPLEVAFAQQNLLDSHDSDRFASHIVNRNLGGYREWMAYHKLSKASNPEYATRKPDTDERAMQKAAVLFQMTYLGAPMVYYGDEAGMWGANDPCCRKPMVWPELQFEQESVLPTGDQRPMPLDVRFDIELHAYYRRLIRLRNELAPLRHGGITCLHTDDEVGVFVFARRYEGEEVVVAVCSSEDPQAVTVEGVTGEFVDRLNDGERIMSKGSTLRLIVPARGGRILLRL